MTAKRAYKKRKINHAMRGEAAQTAIGKIYKGMEIFGITKGQFSIIDIICHLVDQVGVCDVVICTWTAATGDIQRVNDLVYNDKIEKLSFILDRSFITRKPKEFDFLNERCEVVISNVHAKFVTIKNKDWNIVVRSSMNLNKNSRIECFEVSDDVVLYDYVTEIFKDIQAHKNYNHNAFKVVGTRIKGYENSTDEVDDDMADFSFDSSFSL